MALKENKGACFFNTKSEKESHPDFVGNALIGGKEYSMGTWFSKTKDKGELYLYFNFTEKIQE